MKPVFILLASLVSAGLATQAIAAERTGAEIAQTCVMCHGENGLSTMPGTPSLAGQSEIYLVNQLKHFRDGQRQHEQMSVIAKPLSNADIDKVSAWFAQNEVVLKKR
jgi:cytochrome c553